ncbi:MAG: AAA family ATPase, partial [Halomonas sp.]
MSQSSKDARNDRNDPTPDLFGDLLDDAPRPADDAQPTTQGEGAGATLHDVAALIVLLDRWVARGWLRALDRALAVFLQREVNDASPPLLLAAALASHQLGRGHVCLDLAQTLAAPDLALSLPPEGDDLSDPPPLPSEVLAGLELATWRAALDHPLLIADGNDPQPGNTPLVRTEHNGNVRLYLRRYWQYEQDIRQHITARLGGSASKTGGDLEKTTESPAETGGDLEKNTGSAAETGVGLVKTTGSAAETGGSLAPPSEEGGINRSHSIGSATEAGGSSALPSEGAARRQAGPTHTASTANTATLSTALNALFTTTELDWQKTACALAAQAHFAVITGGPGTGKTTTVIRLLALLQSLTLNAHKPALRIALAAPTGKAAARLNES